MGLHEFDIQGAEHWTGSEDADEQIKNHRLLIQLYNMMHFVIPGVTNLFNLVPSVSPFLFYEEKCVEHL